MAGLDLNVTRPGTVIICTLCRYALSPAGGAILKRQKHNVSLNACEGLIAYVKHLRLHHPNKPT